MSSFHIAIAATLIGLCVVGLVSKTLLKRYRHRRQLTGSTILDFVQLMVGFGIVIAGVLAIGAL